MKGKVYLVGAGPGDPELLTLKALNVLGQADAVLHDDLVSAEILSLAPKNAAVYDVGKRSGQKSTRQEAIHFLMIELARQGLNVVRLKGGDPTIFGRAGEEIRALRDAGIEFEIIPGVTSALAAAAAAEISLTMRDTASSLLILTGHFAEGYFAEGHFANDPGSAHGAGKNRQLPDLRALVEAGTTIALYMPGADPEVTVSKLIGAGLAMHTPCAVVARASLPDQKIIVTTLAELAFAQKYAKPSILIVGDVARPSQNDRTGLAELSAPSFIPSSGIERREIAEPGFDVRLSRDGVAHG